MSISHRPSTVYRVVRRDSGRALTFGVVSTLALESVLFAMRQAHADATTDVTYTSVSGKSRQPQRTATESWFTFAKGATRLVVMVRAPGNATAVLARSRSSDENAQPRSTASSAATGEYAYPALFQVGGNAVLVSESDVDRRYTGSRLSHTTGSGRFMVLLVDAQVPVSAGFTSSWRTAIIRTPATVVASTPDDDVGPPSKIADTSWITPGVSAGSWLDGYDTAQRHPNRQQQYVDHAACRGWEYVIVDTATWMPELVTYARDREVKIILWSRYTDVDTDAERRTRFDRIAGGTIPHSFQRARPNSQAVTGESTSAGAFPRVRMATATSRSSGKGGIRWSG